MAGQNDGRREKPKSGAAEADRLRDEIDRGGAGDKVAFSDPAAAPLGTDAEAGGNPPSATQAERARHQETRRAEAESTKARPSDLQGGAKGKAGVGLVVAVAVLCLIFLFLLFS